MPAWSTSKGNSAPSVRPSDSQSVCDAASRFDKVLKAFVSKVYGVQDLLTELSIELLR